MDITKQQAGVTYTQDEIMAAAQAAFGVTPEVVAGAARLAGRTEMTRSEWQEAIQRFLTREV